MLYYKIWRHSISSVRFFSLFIGVCIEIESEYQTRLA